jgi:hypothetical protein
MVAGAMTLSPYTHVAAAVTVDGDTPAARPAAFATTPAVAAPKATPSCWAVGMQDAVQSSSPRHAAAMVQLLRWA